MGIRETLGDRQADNSFSIEDRSNLNGSLAVSLGAGSLITGTRVSKIVGKEISPDVYLPWSVWSTEGYDWMLRKTVWLAFAGAIMQLDLEILSYSEGPACKWPYYGTLVMFGLIRPTWLASESSGLYSPLCSLRVHSRSGLFEIVVNCRSRQLVEELPICTQRALNVLTKRANAIYCNTQ